MFTIKRTRSRIRGRARGYFCRRRITGATTIETLLYARYLYRGVAAMRYLAVSAFRKRCIAHGVRIRDGSRDESRESSANHLAVITESRVCSFL